MMGASRVAAERGAARGREPRVGGARAANDAAVPAVRRAHREARRLQPDGVHPMHTSLHLAVRKKKETVERKKEEKKQRESKREKQKQKGNPE